MTSSRSAAGSLCWFRNDLRLTDQPALAAALEQGPARALFIVSLEQWRAHDEGDTKMHFRLRGALALETALARLGIALDWLHVPHWADVPAALLAYCREHGIDTVHCNRETGLNERQRDRQCFRLLKEHGIAMHGHNGDTLLEPGTVKTGSDEYYRVFTPFAKRSRELLRGTLRAPLKAPEAIGPAVPLAGEDERWQAGWPAAAPEITQQWPATEEHARERLLRFLDERLDNYAAERDFPARPGVSALSPWLATGQLSVRECFFAAAQRNRGEFDTGSRGAISWMNELLWREFYRHLMHGFPELSKYQPMKPETAGLAWRDDPAQLQAWKEGRTGVPIVDAAMRQLLGTGWMHNRLRMIAAMFLTKNLLIHWREGEAFFMQHLIDADFASNNGGWQWSASTGADAAPYFRIFNPVSQSQKFDPDGHFLRRWVPELAKLSGPDIHDPSPVSRRAIGYPDAIVDLKTTRQRAIDAFKALS